MTNDDIRKFVDLMRENRAKPFVINGAPCYVMLLYGGIQKWIGFKYKLPLRRRKMRK